MADIVSYNPGALQNLVAQQNLPTLTWAAGVAPSGVTGVYRWSQIGNRVTLWFKINGTAGTAVTGVNFALPADMPLPNLWTSQPNSTDLTYGDGAMLAAGAATVALAAVCTLTKTAGGTYQINLFVLSAAVTNAWGQIDYLV
jgi:hypothetical protein